ncbi:hypothetical protein Pmar_PMAR023824 [Perkinsus marinus ATCC 50983]|uniref:Uncharacterized protein n=1 Tax=Perkinsus marinus (strain ATCC 50983 / TXsc) TaxID=423536 RepID=C5KYL5_PERM5|nr:hypothetical protein Pmar_PMAR023824 [Perkinsus marinus ATCC 50983]EER10450.1 hypothetical protein Pmar_PMAR023824 [Perkinsus marinus ATCC 50983]|eukprot:XP_002778655.1 hypothetical protein Pmar_PMAR023824 [Perkinsus marinus ATCC 50983]
MPATRRRSTAKTPVTKKPPFKLSPRKKSTRSSSSTKRLNSALPLQHEQLPSPHAATPVSSVSVNDNAAALSLADSDDMDSQTHSFLKLTMPENGDLSPQPAKLSTIPPTVPPIPPHSHPNALPTTPSIPGHLLAPVPQRRNWLSTWLDLSWYEFISQGWRRMKGHKFDDSNTSLPLTAVILGAQAFMARLHKANLISYAACATTVGLLCDMGYGPQGTLRAKQAFESLIQQIAAAVADNRTPDVDLLLTNHRCFILEQICTSFTGFTPAPPTVPSQPRSSKLWPTSYSWWDRTTRSDWNNYNNTKWWSCGSWDKHQNKNSASSTPAKSDGRK